MNILYHLPVDDVKEVLRELHLVRVLDVEVAPVLHLGLHLLPVLQRDRVHVGRQVHALHVHTVTGE